MLMPCCSVVNPLVASRLLWSPVVCLKMPTCVQILTNTSETWESVCSQSKGCLIATTNTRQKVGLLLWRRMISISSLGYTFSALVRIQQVLTKNIALLTNWSKQSQGGHSHASLQLILPSDKKHLPTNNTHFSLACGGWSQTSRPVWPIL